MDELKPLLLELLTKIDAIQADVAGLKAGQERVEADRQINGVVGVSDIARLGGRIDQIAMHMALMCKPAAK